MRSDLLTRLAVQADPKLANLRDDDGRLPIHYAASANQLEIANILVQTKGFDPDVQVRLPRRAPAFYIRDVAQFEAILG